MDEFEKIQRNAKAQYLKACENYAEAELVTLKIKSMFHQLSGLLEGMSENEIDSVPRTEMFNQVSALMYMTKNATDALRKIVFGR